MGRIARPLVAAALALALGGWTLPQQLETGLVRGAELGGDGHGHRVAAWLTGSDVRVAVAEKGRDFGPARTLARDGGPHYGPQLVVGPDGDALVLWSVVTDGDVLESGGECCTTVRAALISRTGRVTGPVIVLNTAAYGLRVLVGAGIGGRFGIALEDVDARPRLVRLASIHRGFGALERVPGRGVSSLLSFDGSHVRLLSVDSAGLHEVSRDEEGHWSKPSWLFPGEFEGAVFGADALGRQTGVLTTAGDLKKQIFTRTPPAPLARVAFLPHGSASYVPVLAVAPSGAAVVAGIRFKDPSEGGAPGEVLVRIRRPGRRFGSASVVYQSHSDVFVRGLSVAPDGAAAMGLEVGVTDGEVRVLLVRPSGAVRSSELVTTLSPRILEGVLADSHGAAALLADPSGGPVHGLWAVRAR